MDLMRMKKLEADYKKIVDAFREKGRTIYCSRNLGIWKKPNPPQLCLLDQTIICDVPQDLITKKLERVFETHSKTKAIGNEVEGTLVVTGINQSLYEIICSMCKISNFVNKETYCCLCQKETTAIKIGNLRTKVVKLDDSSIDVTLKDTWIDSILELLTPFIRSLEGDKKEQRSKLIQVNVKGKICTNASGIIIGFDRLKLIAK
ncbi:hypothetical protein O6H91_06G058400 [Diphasiastrum complanatum]|uniref:Uncharacterized protein n=1 Tax=Diphasiastrum complanatum TaxID=34168 RepID=A0ACC2DEY4_DIPCM|nr:hypothetical protein O6H91_06G058400 [Diphasiastrum complanatum]